ncbi:flagellin N-terminal helical domain-containing protein [Botrimarina hoheduenensis]|uniref:Flagellar hook-associated protein FlgL n=1 Tax=Botrimarina hoheduenensis TaxID=2528000 RepID=A0A5C5VXR0_9BACT|nr:hypothetical protein [Botrimarina hoheduenensis]TWT42693.1 flagellar hook-associated protein FlgL [Botrimarina hoheduenensis]
MSNILPLSSTRVTGALTRQRITQQVQSDQNELFRLQNQLSTGYRIFLPSDDASAAQRAMALQRSIERKEQSATNLQGAQAALVTTESSLANVSSQLSSLRGEVLGVVGTLSTDEQRSAVINTIDQLMLDLQRVGNTTLTQTHLLGGAQTANAPYSAYKGFVDYYGDELSSQTFIDIGYLFNNSSPGDEVLGGLSEAVRGVVDLQPQLNPTTRLSQINGGLGLSPGGAISLTFNPTATTVPTTTVTIDLSAASTVGDVARLIEAGAPAGAEIAVEVSGNGLRLTATNGEFLIEEVAEGATARELGIRNLTLATASLQGTDLNPRLTITDRLDELVGTRARGRIVSPGDNNDLTITANQNGADFNGVTVEYVAGTAAAAVYTSATNTLTVSVVAGSTTATEVAAAINAEGTFTAQVDRRDQATANLRGTGAVALGASLGVGIDGGSGTTLDLSGGLQITNGGEETFEIDTSSAETVQDLLNLLNKREYGLAASINAAGNGLDIRSRRSGADLTIGENGGNTATALGVRTYTDASRLADFNRGVGVVIETSSADESPTQNRFQITLRDAGTTTTYDIDLTGDPPVTTVADLRAQIAAQTGGAVTAELATVGNGLVLTRTDAVDTAAAATGSATIGGDVLTLTADTPGLAGNRPFTIEVIDSLGGGLTASVVGDAITVDLGGGTPDTDAIATAISNALAGYTVTAPTVPAVVSAPVAVQSFAATGGYEADSMVVSGEIAERLGFFSETDTSITTTTATAASTDRHTLEVDSVFNTLSRMRQALLDGDGVQVGREIDRLDADINRVSFGRAEIGVRLRTLEDVSDRLATEDATLRESLSREIDADLVEVISDLTAQQASLEASLRTSATILSLSILDFI